MLSLRSLGPPPSPTPGKSCKRCNRRLRTFCWKSRYFEDILSQIYISLRLKMENWGWIKEICDMEKWGFRIENCGWVIKIWGFYHALPTFNTNISVHPVSWITLFWGQCQSLNFSARGRFTTCSRSAGWTDLFKRRLFKEIKKKICRYPDFCP